MNSLLFLLMSVWTSCGWVILAITFYLAYLNGNATISLNSFGEMYLEAVVLMPSMVAIAITYPIFLFRKLCKEADNS